jgi:hypothetical protein
MTTAVNTFPSIAVRLINGLLSIKPLANLAKHQARKMMIQRAEKIGVPWRQQVQQLQTHDWDSEMAQVQNTQLVIQIIICNHSMLMTKETFVGMLLLK